MSDVSVGVGAQRVSFHGVRSAVARLGVWWPVLASALLLSGFVGSQIAAGHGSPTGLIQFGSALTHFTRPPAGSTIVPGIGYDGQFYWLQATDPLVLHASTAVRISHVAAGYHLQRPAYPALAWLLAGGQTGLLPWSLLAVNVLTTLGLTAMFAHYARRRGWNPAWALVIGLAPGMLLSTTRDLSDALGTATMLAGLIAFERRRYWAAGCLLTVAALSREPLIPAAAAVGLVVVGRCWHARSGRAAVTLLREQWPSFTLPAAGFVGWQIYLHTLHASHSAHPLPSVASGSTDSALLPPFNDIVQAARSAIASGSAAHAAFILPYLALTVAAVVISLWLLLQRRTAPALMAVLYGVFVLPLSFLSDQLALTRYTMPLFFCLLLAGLERRSRPALVVSASATAMTFLLPLLAY